MNVPPHILKLFAAWARQKGIARPTTDEGMKALLAQFFNELRGRANQYVSFALHQFGEDPQQIARHDLPTHFTNTDGALGDIAEVETEDSDFTELVRERAAALADADGDDLAAGVLYRDRVEAQENEKAPIFADAPPSWKKSVFGQSLVVQPSQQDTTLPGPMQQVANWPGDLRESRAVTVTFGPQLNQRTTSGRLSITADPTGVRRPLALIQWGTDNNFFQAQVDAGTGMILTFSCCSLTVSMGLDGGSTAPMEVSGSFAFGTAPHPTPCTRTAYVDAQTNNAASVLHRPPFATTIVAVERSDFTAPITLTYKDLAGTTIGVRTILASASLDAPLWLPNDCVIIETSTSTAGPFALRVVFGLTL